MKDYDLTVDRPANITVLNRVFAHLGVKVAVAKHWESDGGQCYFHCPDGVEVEDSPVGTFYQETVEGVHATSEHTFAWWLSEVEARRDTFGTGMPYHSGWTRTSIEA